MKFQELRIPNIHSLEGHIRGAETLSFPSSMQPEAQLDPSLATDNVVIDLRGPQITIELEEARDLETVTASLTEGSDPRPPRSAIPPVSPIQAQRVLGNMFPGRSDNSSPSVPTPKNDHSVLPLGHDHSDVTDVSQTDWSQWEEEIKEVGVRIAPRRIVSAEDRQAIAEKTRKVSRFKLALQRNKYMFGQNHFEESGGQVSRVRILLGHVRPICRVDEYDRYLGKAMSSEASDDIDKRPLDITLDSSQQPEDQVINTEVTAKDTTSSSVGSDWILARSVKINEFAGAIVERAKDKRVMAAAATVGGVVLSLYLLNRHGVSTQGSNSSNHIAEAIGNITPKQGASKIDKGSEWYNIWATNHPGTSVEQFNDIINSQSFADMCNNPAKFALLAGV